ncbi:glycosyltransferase family 2 protein [Sphingomonas sp.]|uniref:glycosyltransferase family 2 protein n=1 Tax=Sphingomonas sp. TaxID=28214 RepID=UPI0038B3DB98
MGIVTVNHRTPGLTAACLASLRQERDRLPGLKAIVVDGGSGDNSAEELAKFIDRPEYRDWVELMPLAINGGFGWANNHAISRLIGQGDPPEYIHLLNPDSEIEPGAVRCLADYLDAHPRVAAVGSQLLELDGSWTGSAFSFPTIRGEFARGAGTGAIDRLLKVPPVAIESAEAREVEWATGASVMIRREALEQVGLFDEGFFLYHEEIELMWRMRRAGWAIATEPRSRVRHVGGGSTGVHSREVVERLRPRRPHYWYRSRARLFGLTRGRLASWAAFCGWIMGHGIWRIRRLLGLTGNAKLLDHEVRDFLKFARPRRDDFASAPVPALRQPSRSPVWMQKRWL